MKTVVQYDRRLFFETLLATLTVFWVGGIVVYYSLNSPTMFLHQILLLLMSVGHGNCCPCCPTVTVFLCVFSSYEMTWSTVMILPFMLVFMALTTSSVYKSCGRYGSVAPVCLMLNDAE